MFPKPNLFFQSCRRLKPLGNQLHNALMLRRSVFQRMCSKNFIGDEWKTIEFGFNECSVFSYKEYEFINEEMKIIIAELREKGWIVDMIPVRPDFDEDGMLEYFCPRIRFIKFDGE